MSTEITMQHAKRPVWVWIISIFFLVSAGYTLLSFALIYSGSISVTPAQRAYFSSLSFLDHATTVVISSLNLIGALQLFLLKRNAPLLFLSAFIVGIATFTYQILARNWLSAITGPALIGAALGQLLLIVIIFYSFRLRSRKILN